jgi:hypothetical protein
MQIKGETNLRRDGRGRGTEADGQDHKTRRKEHGVQKLESATRFEGLGHRTFSDFRRQPFSVKSIGIGDVDDFSNTTSSKMHYRSHFSS